MFIATQLRNKKHIPAPAEPNVAAAVIYGAPQEVL